MSITIELSNELQQECLKFAREQNITQEEFMKKALMRYLEDLEDLQSAIEGREARLRGEGGESWSSVKRELGL